MAVRAGLMKKYGWKSEDEAKNHVKVYDRYEELLDNPDIEAVVIALPLHLHAEAAIKAMRKGKHVLTEKLMGQTVAQCKEMGRVSAETKKLLATGHQRHYSILYDNAKHTIRNGFIGDIHSIRAQWHRANLPGTDSWQPPVPSADRDLDKLNKELAGLKKKLDTADASQSKSEREKLTAQFAQKKAQLEDQHVDAIKNGYLERTITDPATGKEYKVGALEELIRWRLWARTGGGLMAELGSHQLDAATIFCTEAARNPDPSYKAHPLTVTAMGGRYIFPYDRDAEDHVYCMYEFPGQKYVHADKKTHDSKIGVTYSTINGNGFGDYGEIVMGTKGTLVLDKEAEAMLFVKPSVSTKVSVAASGNAARHHGQRRRGGPLGRRRQGGSRSRPDQPRLHRRDGTLRMVRSQPNGREHRTPSAHAALPSEGRHGRRDHRVDHQHLHARPVETADRIPRRVVRHRQRCHARRRPPGREETAIRHVQRQQDELSSSMTTT
ncbi:MAG: Gfo/Idh/MocA family oxidoreductase [Pirellulales bacterium]